MKKILFLALFFGLSSTLFADLPLPPHIQKKQNQHWDALECKDKKNLIICEYALPSPHPDDCRKYQNDNKKFKFLGRKGGTSFGEEKYCHRVGPDLK